MRNAVWARRTVLRLALGSALAGLLLAATPAQPPPLRQRTRLDRRRLPLVVIDPGHGGIDPGAIGAEFGKAGAFGLHLVGHGLRP
jgi:N-acetylmuramoyl-L-alanine amidase